MGRPIMVRPRITGARADRSWRAGDHATPPPQENGPIRQADRGCGKQE
jgi:hypothetical protein